MSYRRACGDDDDRVTTFDSNAELEESHELPSVVIVLQRLEGSTRLKVPSRAHILDVERLAYDHLAKIDASSMLARAWRASVDLVHSLTRFSSQIPATSTKSGGHIGQEDSICIVPNNVPRQEYRNMYTSDGKFIWRGGNGSSSSTSVDSNCSSDQQSASSSPRRSLPDFQLVKKNGAHLTQAALEDNFVFDEPPYELAVVPAHRPPKFAVTIIPLGLSAPFELPIAPEKTGQEFAEECLRLLSLAPAFSKLGAMCVVRHDTRAPIDGRGGGAGTLDPHRRGDYSGWKPLLQVLGQPPYLLNVVPAGLVDLRVWGSPQNADSFIEFTASYRERTEHFLARVTKHKKFARGKSDVLDDTESLLLTKKKSGVVLSKVYLLDNFIDDNLGPPFDINMIVVSGHQYEAAKGRFSVSTFHSRDSGDDAFNGHVSIVAADEQKSVPRGRFIVTSQHAQPRRPPPPPPGTTALHQHQHPRPPPPKPPTGPVRSSDAVLPSPPSAPRPLPQLQQGKRPPKRPTTLRGALLLETP